MGADRRLTVESGPPTGVLDRLVRLDAGGAAKVRNGWEADLARRLPLTPGALLVGPFDGSRINSTPVLAIYKKCSVQRLRAHHVRVRSGRKPVLFGQIRDCGLVRD